MRQSNLSILLVALTFLVAGPASAESADVNPVLNDRFSIYLGGFFPQIKSEVILNGTMVPGDNVDFENAFGLEDSKNVLWGGVRWRISKRNFLEFEFADLNRNGLVGGVTDPIQIGDSFVQIGASVATTFDITLGRLTYGFAVIADEKKNWQLKAGLHIADLGTSFQMTGDVCLPGEDPMVPPGCSIFSGTTPRFETEEVTVPLPHFGTSFSYAFTPNLGMRLQVIGFALKINDIKGSLVEVDADVIWNPWRHFGLGAGLRYFNVNIDSDGSDLNGEFDFRYYGPAVYVISTF